jgi:hypothetical protein
MSLCRLGSNIVPVEKKNTGKIRICVYFRNLNRATPKDEYLMPVADLLVDSASGNKVLVSWTAMRATIKSLWRKKM